MKFHHFALAMGILAGWLLGHSALISPVVLHAAVAEEAAVDALINLNQADAEELQKVRGIGPAIAERIMLHRQEFGPFETVDELAQIRGIGGAKLEKIKTQVIV